MSVQELHELALHAAGRQPLCYDTPMTAFESELLQGLNEPQRQAVTHRDGPLLVLAGPGSGKTRVITRRAAWLIQNGVFPRNILAITFTNKAATEMRQRIEALGVGRGAWVYTFHALGVRLLREFAPLAGLQPGFTIYDESDQKSVLADAYQATGIRDTNIRVDAAQSAISDAKNRLITPVEFMADADLPDRVALARLYEAYEQLLQQRNAVDFDDLLTRPALLLRRRADIAEELNIRFKYLLIDEYQDTNRAQYVIARELSRHHGNVCATGDPDQSIYAWRGADIGNILAFERDYPDATVIRLEQNYRSTASILRVADRLIEFNSQRKAKRLWTENPDGTPVEIWRFGDDREEAERIAAMVQEQARQGRAYSDFAIFYRINALSRGMEDALRHRGIPYQIARGVEFYNRKEIRDALAYLRVMVNPTDEVGLLRCVNTPPRGIGKTTIEKLLAAAQDTKKPLLELMRDAGAGAGIAAATAKKLAGFTALVAELQRFAESHTIADTIAQMLERSALEDHYSEDDEGGGEDRLANLRELVSAAARYEEESPADEEVSLVDFLRRVSLQSDQDSVDASAGCVMLMTLHTAKGLEFPVVFVAGVEHGLLPHERALSKDGDVEEERRLCFVGVTRARERLYLCHAQTRLLRGQVTPRIASQFLRELEAPGATQRSDFSRNLRPRSAWAGAVEPESDEVVDADTADSGTVIQFPRNRWNRGGNPEERVFSVNDGTRAGGLSPAPAGRPRGAFDSWKPGMLVQHKTYGVGTIVWIQPATSQTRAAVKFAGAGEKTFVLELAPIEILTR